MRAAPVLTLLLGLAGCGSLGRLTDSLSPWPEFGSSRQLTDAAGPLAPYGSLTRRRVADGVGRRTAAPPDAQDEVPPWEDAAAPIRPEPGNVWPREETRQNTLADFERSLRDGTPPPPPPRNAVP